MVDQFPMDQNRIIQDLARRVAALEAQAGQAQGLQITKASAAFLIPETSTPATPSSGAYLYVTAGGEARWRSTTGDRSMGAPQAAYVAHAPNMTAGATAPGTYSPAYAEALRTDIFNVRATLAEEMNALRASGLQASS
jgi:hypothetical protein